MTELVFGVLYALGFSTLVMAPLVIADLVFNFIYNRSAGFRRLVERTLGNLPAWKYK